MIRIEVTGMMRRYALFLPMIIILCGCADERTDRALAFKKGIYTGQHLPPEEWLAQDVRNSAVFTRYGGLNALIGDSTGEAARNGGFQRARAVMVREQNGVSLVETEVLFRNGRTVSSVEAWIREDGKWKLTLRTEGK